MPSAAVSNSEITMTEKNYCINPDMLDLQIKQEEEFCRAAFGKEYEEYSKRVRRYL